MPGKQLFADLMSLEEGFWANAGDPAFYEEHFTDDGIIALSAGMIDKPGVMSAMERAEPWDKYVLHDPRLIDVGDDVAALVYTATARRESDDSDYTPVVTSVYVLRNEEWKLIVHQQTSSG